MGKALFPSPSNRRRSGRGSETLRLPYCGGPLHRGVYVRKPRGGPPGLPESYSVRLSLCCGREGCRRRTLPPSLLFWGRRVYWGATLVVITALRQQRATGFTMRRIREQFGVRRATVLRWMAYFREVFPHSRIWQSLRSRWMPPVADEAIPATVLERLRRSRDGPEEAVVGCLRLLGLPQCSGPDR